MFIFIHSLDHLIQNMSFILFLFYFYKLFVNYSKIRTKTKEHRMSKKTDKVKKRERAAHS